MEPVVLQDGTGYVLTRNGPGDVTEQWRAPEHDADHVVDRALALAVTGRTNRLGRMLAPMGVRYVTVPSTQGRGGGGASAPRPVALRRAMAQQLDFAQLRSAPGLVLYENLAYAPIAAAVPPPRLPVDPVRPNLAALTTDLTRAQPLSDGDDAGTVLWGEAYDEHWEATAGGDTLRHQRAFSWANGFRIVDGSDVSIAYTAQWVRWVVLVGALLLWVLVALRWRRTRTRREPRSSAPRRERRERRERVDPLADLDDDALWWERV
jgi:hypothetical protein